MACCYLSSSTDVHSRADLDCAPWAVTSPALTLLSLALLFSTRCRVDHYRGTGRTPDMPVPETILSRLTIANDRVAIPSPGMRFIARRWSLSSAVGGQRVGVVATWLPRYKRYLDTDVPFPGGYRLSRQRAG